MDSRNLAWRCMDNKTSKRKFLRYSRLKQRKVQQSTKITNDVLKLGNNPCKSYSEYVAVRKSILKKLKKDQELDASLNTLDDSYKYFDLLKKNEIEEGQNESVLTLEENQNRDVLVNSWVVQKTTPKSRKLSKREPVKWMLPKHPKKNKTKKVEKSGRGSESIDVGEEYLADIHSFFDASEKEQVKNADSYSRRSISEELRIDENFTDEELLVKSRKEFERENYVTERRNRKLAQRSEKETKKTVETTPGRKVPMIIATEKLATRFRVISESDQSNSPKRGRLQTIKNSTPGEGNSDFLKEYVTFLSADKKVQISDSKELNSDASMVQEESTLNVDLKSGRGEDDFPNSGLGEGDTDHQGDDTERISTVARNGSEVAAKSEKPNQTCWLETESDSEPIDVEGFDDQSPEQDSFRTLKCNNNKTLEIKELCDDGTLDKKKDVTPKDSVEGKKAKNTNENSEILNSESMENIDSDIDEIANEEELKNKRVMSSTWREEINVKSTGSQVQKQENEENDPDSLPLKKISRMNFYGSSESENEESLSLSKNTKNPRLDAKAVKRKDVTDFEESRKIKSQKVNAEAKIPVIGVENDKKEGKKNKKIKEIVSDARNISMQEESLKNLMEYSEDRIEKCPRDTKVQIEGRKKKSLRNEDMESSFSEKKEQEGKLIQKSKERISKIVGLRPDKKLMKEKCAAWNKNDTVEIANENIDENQTNLDADIFQKENQIIRKSAQEDEEKTSGSESEKNFQNRKKKIDETWSFSAKNSTDNHSHESEHMNVQSVEKDRKIRKVELQSKTSTATPVIPEIDEKGVQQNTSESDEFCETKPSLKTKKKEVPKETKILKLSKPESFEDKKKRIEKLKQEDEEKTQELESKITQRKNRTKAKKKEKNDSQKKLNSDTAPEYDEIEQIDVEFSEPPSKKQDKSSPKRFSARLAQQNSAKTSETEPGQKSKEKMEEKCPVAEGKDFKNAPETKTGYKNSIAQEKNKKLGLGVSKIPKLIRPDTFEKKQQKAESKSKIKPLVKNEKMANIPVANNILQTANDREEKQTETDQDETQVPELVKQKDSEKENSDKKSTQKSGKESLKFESNENVLKRKKTAQKKSNPLNESDSSDTLYEKSRKNKKNEEQEIGSLEEEQSNLKSFAEMEQIDVEFPVSASVNEDNARSGKNAINKNSQEQRKKNSNKLLSEGCERFLTHEKKRKLDVEFSGTEPELESKKQEKDLVENEQDFHKIFAAKTYVNKTKGNTIHFPLVFRETMPEKKLKRQKQLNQKNMLSEEQKISSSSSSEESVKKTTNLKNRKIPKETLHVNSPKSITPKNEQEILNTNESSVSVERSFSGKLQTKNMMEEVIQDETLNSESLWSDSSRTSQENSMTTDQSDEEKSNTRSPEPRVRSLKSLKTMIEECSSPEISIDKNMEECEEKSDSAFTKLQNSEENLKQVQSPQLHDDEYFQMKHQRQSTKLENKKEKPSVVSFVSSHLKKKRKGSDENEESLKEGESRESKKFKVGDRRGIEDVVNSRKNNGKVHEEKEQIKKSKGPLKSRKKCLEKVQVGNESEKFPKQSSDNGNINENPPTIEGDELKNDSINKLQNESIAQQVLNSDSSAKEDGSIQKTFLHDKERKQEPSIAKIAGSNSNRKIENPTEEKNVVLEKSRVGKDFEKEKESEVIHAEISNCNVIGGKKLENEVDREYLGRKSRDSESMATDAEFKSPEGSEKMLSRLAGTQKKKQILSALLQDAEDGEICMLNIPEKFLRCELTGKKEICITSNNRVVEIDKTFYRTVENLDETFLCIKKFDEKLDKYKANIVPVKAITLHEKLEKCEKKRNLANLLCPNSSKKKPSVKKRTLKTNSFAVHNKKKKV